MEVHEIFEIVGAILATYAFTFGLGKTFYKGYQEGRCLVPRVMFWHLHIFAMGGMICRIIVFITSGSLFWFFIAVDVVAVIVSAAIILQYAGYLVKQQPMKDKS